jgi:hypothetical protein
LDNKENEDFEAVTTEDEKEKTPELSSLIHSHSVGLNNQQDSGIDANSQASSSEPDSNSAKIGSNHSTSSSVGHCATTKNMANSDDSMVSKNHHSSNSSNMDNSTSNNNITTSNETRASSKGKAKNKKNKKLQGKSIKKTTYFVTF